jgi:hypothetical protein
MYQTKWESAGFVTAIAGTSLVEIVADDVPGR